MPTKMICKSCQKKANSQDMIRKRKKRKEKKFQKNEKELEGINEMEELRKC